MIVTNPSGNNHSRLERPISVGLKYGSDMGLNIGAPLMSGSTQAPNRKVNDCHKPFRQQSFTFRMPDLLRFEIWLRHGAQHWGSLDVRQHSGTKSQGK